MEESARFLLTVGAILLFGLFASALAKWTHLPRITLLLLIGIVIGKNGIDVVPIFFSDNFETIAEMALLMVGFLLGGKLTREVLSASIGTVLWISISAALTTTIAVGMGLALVGVPIEVSILLGCIASATAPAAVFDVVKESGVESRFSNLLIAIVAFDDIWALIIFSLGVAAVTYFNGGEYNSLIWLFIKELGGAVFLGVLIGLPAAYLTGRLKKGQPMLTEALGLVFLCGGLAIWIEVSFLISSIVMGSVIANLAKHHDYPFHAIEGIEWPFMVVFFVLAGASLELAAFEYIGVVGLFYIAFRSLGKYTGAWLGGQVSGVGGRTQNWLGVALLPQAGVSIGMALVAANQFPDFHQILISTVIGTTIVFEIIGPVITRLAIKKTCF